MVLAYFEDAHLYRMFKHNMIKYGTGKMVINLYGNLEQLRAFISSDTEFTGVLVSQSTESIAGSERIKSIRLDTEDLYDDSGVRVSLSFCRPFEELIHLIQSEVDLSSTLGLATKSRSYYGICDESISRVSLLQRLSSMAVQYNRFVMMIDLDFNGEIQEEVRSASERFMYQLLHNGKIYWNGLESKEYPHIFYLKPFNQIADSHLLDHERLSQMREAACKHGIEFILVLHNGNLSAPALSYGKSFDVNFVLGTSFGREKTKTLDFSDQEGLKVFSNTTVSQSGDLLADWHMYMNNEMRCEKR